MNVLPAVEDQRSAAPGTVSGGLAGHWPSILEAPPGACQAREGRCGAGEWPLGNLPTTREEVDDWLEHRRQFPYLELRCANGHHRYVRLPVPSRPDRFTIAEAELAANRARLRAVEARRAAKRLDRAARAAGGEDPRMFWTPTRVAQLQGMWVQGASLEDMAAVFGRRPSSIPGAVSSLRRKGYAFPSRNTWGGYRPRGAGYHGGWA